MKQEERTKRIRDAHMSCVNARGRIVLRFNNAKEGE